MAFQLLLKCLRGGRCELYSFGILSSGLKQVTDSRLRASGCRGKADEWESLVSGLWPSDFWDWGAVGTGNL